MTLIDNPAVVVETARRLTADFRTLSGIFPQLDEKAVLNLALLVATGAPVVSSPPAPEVVTKTAEPEDTPKAEGYPVPDEYKMSLVEALLPGCYNVRELLAKVPPPPPTIATNPEAYLRYVIAYDPAFRRLRNNRIQLTAEGLDWAKKYTSAEPAEWTTKGDKKPLVAQGPAPALPPSIEALIEECPTMVRQCYGAMGDGKYTAKQVVKAIKNRGWPQRSKHPLRFVTYVLNKNPKVFKRVSGRGISAGPSQYSRIKEAAPAPAKPPAPEPAVSVKATLTIKSDTPLMNLMAAAMGTDAIDSVELTRRLTSKRVDLSRFEYAPAYLSAILDKQPGVFELVADAASAPECIYRVRNPEKYSVLADALKNH